MKDQKTRRGFMHMFLHAAVHWVIFKLGTRFVSMSNGWVIHCLRVMIIPIESLYSADWLLFRSSMVFGVYFIESMLPSHTNDMPISLKIVCPEAYSPSSPSYQSTCVSPTLIITSSTLVSCQLMKDTSMPSLDGFCPVDFNTSSGIEI